MRIKITFFQNGNTMAFDEDGNQLPYLQESWLLLYAEFLAAQGVDPTEVEFVMPDGRLAKMFKLNDGSYNWRMDMIPG